jgi:hypothetical protein
MIIPNRFIAAFGAVLFFANLCFAQVELPAGTKIGCRLEQTLSSATAEEGQTVNLSVTENVRVNGAVVIPQGAMVAGTIVQAVPKRRMGRTGKLDFSIDKVRATDGEYVPLRYTMQKKEGGSHGVRTGVITAGVAVAFWPAAPLVLLMKGKDITINRGVVFDVFTDQPHVLAQNINAPGPAPQIQGAPDFRPQPVATLVRTSQGFVAPAAQHEPSVPDTAVSITSDIPGAEIEINGAYMGSTPSTVTLTPGQHRIAVRNGAHVWQRTIQIQGGGSITVNALLRAK